MESLKIEVFSARELTCSIRGEILTLCTDAYEEDFAPYLDLLGSAVHVLVRLNGKLVSHAAWVERELRASNLTRPLKSAYIEAVATPVALQRRGYGSAAHAAIPPLLGSFDIAALSPSEGSFYSRLGWEHWEGRLEYRRGVQTFATPDEEVMVLRLPGTPASLDTRATLSVDWREGDVW